MRKPLTRLSRVASRQAESALQPPGVAIRGVAALPLLALALLLLGHATMAWFHGTTQAGGSLLSSGTFASLMTLNTDQLQFTGLRGSDFQGSFTVTSKAGVSVPLAASWEGGGGPGSLSLSSPVIHPGETVTVTLAGTFGADYGGQAVVTIGQEGYDYGRLAVSVNVSTIPVQDLIQVTVVGDGVFKSGMAAPAFEWVKVMKVTQQPGALPADITVTVTQTPEDTHPVAVRPSTFRSTTAGTDILNNKRLPLLLLLSLD